MKTLTLPHTDLTVSQFCFGAGAIGTALKDDEADHLLASFVESGGNFFDTAHCYSFWVPNGLGASERELGASLRRIGAWDDAIVATKGGHPDGGLDYPRPPDFLSERVIHSDVEESLNRLGADHLDLFYLHRDDGKTPVGEIIEILNREIQQERLRAIGSSNWSIQRMAAANAYASEHGLQGFVISQVQWSLSVPDWSEGPDPTVRTVHPEDIAWHAQTGIPIAAYSSTGNGFFAKDLSASNPINRARWNRAREISVELGYTPTQVAVAWLLHQKPRVIPVFSTTKQQHLAEVLAADQVILEPQHLSRLSGEE